jgi:hypothetical protein
MHVMVDYQVMDTHIRITIHGVNAETPEFIERLEQFLSVDQPWSGDPNVRVGCMIRATDADSATE